MPKKYIHFTFLFFFLTSLSGVFMRYVPFLSDSILPYENILHGHSHLAILGWAFLGAFVIFISLEWDKIAKKKQALAICFALVVVSLLMFLAFLWQGYDVFSIIFSTLHIFIEYWAAIFIYKQIKGINYQSTIYFKGALIALVLSSLGPYALGIISANGMKESAIFDMAIYFYLHFQYNGWLSLFLMGLFLYILEKNHVPFRRSWIKHGFWLYFISLFPGYFLSILWAEEIIDVGYMLGIIGSIGQWLGIVCMLFALIPSLRSLKNHFSKLTLFGLEVTFLLLFLKSTFELGLISPVLSSMVYETRSVVIGYLHLTLLGFISCFILVQFLMINLLNTNKRSILGFVFFFIGFALNELFLFLQTLMDWLGLGAIPNYMEGLLLASILLAVGIFIIWLSQERKK